MALTNRVQSYDFVELWAGHAVTSKVVRKAGKQTAALDITYFEQDPKNKHRSNHFDILTASGFAFLGLLSASYRWLNSQPNLNSKCQKNESQWALWNFEGVNCSPPPAALNIDRTVHPCMLRLAVATVLNAKHDAFTCLMAIVCSSWTTINMGTSGRHISHPTGREELEYIAKANKMASRSFSYI